MIKLIIFDGYGVVIKGGYPDTAEKVAKRFHIGKERAYAIIYRKYFNAAATRKMSQTEAWNLAVKELNLPISGEELKQIHYSTFGLNKKIFVLAKKWQKQGIKTLLLSKNTRPQFKDINNIFPELKEIFGRNIINTWELGLAKASKETFSYVFKKYNVKPQEVIVLDDQQGNLLPAKKMGVQTILYKNLLQLKKEIGKLV